jgi:two-component system nitrogen regulation response regulator NtrX
MEDKTDTTFLRRCLARLTGAPKILVVEENAEDLKRTLELLTKFNCTAVGCGDSFQAIGMMKKDKFDLVFLDVLMPRLANMDVVQEIHPVSPETQYVLVTGHGDNPMISSPLRSGALMIVKKPIGISDLSSVLTHKIDE